MGRISRSVPLEQLRQPETDVRERRPEDGIKSLASSMGDPAVGQLQDVLVHPVDPDDVVEEGTDDELHELFAEGHDMRIVDGETRRLAATRLGWATLDATIVPSPPEDTVVAQLDANTERIEMDEFETVRALYEYYSETEATLSDMGDKTGFSESYLSQVFSLMEAPEWLKEPWRHPEHPVETSHALAIMPFLKSNTVERYAQAGGLDEAEAYERAVEDGKMMIDVQAEHELTVGQFRERCDRLVKQTADELSDQRDLEDKQAEGQRRSAERDHTPAEIAEPDPCLVCGADRPNRRKVAVPVCAEDYGMIEEMKANGEVLMANASTEETVPATTEDDVGGLEGAAEALAAAAGITVEDAAGVVQEVQQQASQAPHEGQHD